MQINYSSRYVAWLLEKLLARQMGLRMALARQTTDAFAVRRAAPLWFLYLELSAGHAISQLVIVTAVADLWPAGWTLGFESAPARVRSACSVGQTTSPQALHQHQHLLDRTPVDCRLADSQLVDPTRRPPVGPLNCKSNSFETNM